MKKSIPASTSKSFEKNLKEYFKTSKAIILKPFKNPKSMLPLGAAFLAGTPSAEAAIIYSGVQNVPVNIPVNFNQASININGAGGLDFEIQNNVVAGVAFIQANEMGVGDFALNAFIGKLVGNYGYPYANAAGFSIGAGGPWANGVGDANSLADNAANENQYPNTRWETDGMTAFIGFRGVLSGGTKYGWIRLTRNTHTNWTIVDWAWENSGTSILAGTTAAVSLVDFSGSLKADAMHLTWRTAEEVNNAGFEVERSEDGTNFRSIAWVDGHGTTTDFKDYYYDDKNLREGKTYYYRLRQVDNTGEFHFSPIVTATIFGEGPVVSEFYPNPSATGQVSIDFAAKLDGNWSVTVYDVAGKELRREEVAMTEGLNSLNFDFSGLGSGLFFIKMDNGSEKLYRRLTIK